MNEEHRSKEPEVQKESPEHESAMEDAQTAEKKGGSEWVGLLYLIVALFVFIAAFQLYFTMLDLIRTWISDQFVPVVSAIYYILIIGIGVWLIRDYIQKL